MPTQHRWIDKPSDLEAFCASIEDGDVVALDTESDHFFAYRPYVALIQVATREEALLVDPLALTGDDLDPLLAIVEDPKVVTIMHSARNDIGELDRDWGIEAQNIFDTQLAARFLGYEKFGLNDLLQATAGISLDKKYQRFDWAKRPIPKPAQEYAVGDVIYLFDLRERLLRELEEAKWLAAFEEHSEYLVRSSGYENKEFDPEDWRRLKGSKTLDDVGRAVCAALYEYRHELCDKLNRAPLHIFENSAVVAVARERPTTMKELESIRQIRSHTVRHNGDDILRIVRESLSAEPPPVKRPRRGARQARQTNTEKERLKSLLSLRQELAEKTKLPIDVVLSRSTLEEIAGVGPKRIDDLVEVDGLLNWQRELFGKQLVRASAV